jgi:hypothetical protein
VAVGSVTGQRELAARTVEQENLPLSRLRSPLGYQPAPRPAGYPRLPPAGWPGSLPGGFPRPARSWFPGPASLPGFVPGPGALFSGLGCNAPAIAATGLLAYGS